VKALWGFLSLHAGLRAELVVNTWYVW
jgi:hypothetical protein